MTVTMSPANNRPTYWDPETGTTDPPTDDPTSTDTQEGDDPQERRERSEQTTSGGTRTPSDGNGDSFDPTEATTPEQDTPGDNRPSSEEVVGGSSGTSGGAARQTGGDVDTGPGTPSTAETRQEARVDEGPIRQQQQNRPSVLTDPAREPVTTTEEPSGGETRIGNVEEMAASTDAYRTATAGEQQALDAAFDVGEGQQVDSEQVAQQARDFEQQIIEETGATRSDVSISVVERGGEVTFQPQFAEDFQRQQAAETLTREFAPLQQEENRPTQVPESQVTGDDRVQPSDIELTDAGATLTEAAVAERTAERTAEQFQEQGMDVSPSDIQTGDGQTGLTGAARERLETQQEQQALTNLEQQAEQQIGRDLQRGEDFTVSQDGDRLELEWTNQFLQEQAERDIEERAGRDQLETLFGPASGIAAGAADITGVAGLDVAVPDVGDVPADAARTASPLQAGEDFTVDVDRVSEQEAGTLDVMEGIARQTGIASEDFETPEAGEPNINVELTEQFREEQRQAQQGGGGSEMGFFESVAQPVIGPPGNIEQDVGYAVSDPVGAATGPAGTLEREARWATVGALGAAITGGGDPFNVAGGKPGSIESGAGDVAGDIGAASESAVGIVGPAVADVTGDVGEIFARQKIGGLPVLTPSGPSVVESDTRESYADLARAPENEQGERTVFEQLGEGAGRGAVEATVGLPAGAVSAGNIAADAAEFTAAEVETEGVVEGTASAALAGGQFTYQAGETIVSQAERNPAYFAGVIGGGAAGGAAATPLRIARTDVPTTSGGTTAVRGLRVREPAITRPLTGRQRGRTVAGTRGYRPTIGAPSIRNLDVDYSALGSTGTFTAEAMSSFEADIFRATAGDIGGEAASRFSTAESVQRQATRAGRTEFQFDTAEEALGEARAVPESAVPDVADALGELDATVFGSVATRARVEGFRQPRDIDITLPERRQAPKTAPIEEQFPESAPRLQSALEGETATVSDVFDIKTEAEAPGRAFGGEEIKYGFESMEPDELGGVRFNPAEEELVRKAGASAFLRGEGAAATPELDVGPEPRRPGRPDVREKDVTDTAAIGREILGEGSVSEFESAFGLASETAETGGFLSTGAVGVADLDLPDGVQAFRQDTRGQVGIGGTLGAADTTDVRRVETDTDTRTPTETETGAGTGVREPSPSPTTSPGGGGTPFTASPLGSPGSPGTRTDVDSTSPATTPSADSGGLFGGSPTTDAGTSDTTVPSPFGAAEPQETAAPVASPGEQPDSDASPITAPTGGGGFGITPTPSPPPGPPTDEVPAFDAPVSPLTTPFGGGTPETRTVVPQLGTDDKDPTPYRPEAPTGQEFVNPVATGQSFLFGNLGGGGGNGGENNADIRNPFRG